MDKSNIESYYFQLFKKYKSACLFPNEKCKRKVINAHSVQNEKVLDLINENGHVYSYAMVTDKEHNPIYNFKYIGRNEASTFAGLCNYHDNLLFKEIDTHLDLTNNKHLFLIAYRSILKESHINYKKLENVEYSFNGDIPLNEIEKVYLYYLYSDAMEYMTYKKAFDDLYLDNKFIQIKHKILFFNIPPTLACSQLFSADSIKFKDTVLRICLNIFPVNSFKTAVIFSTFNEEYDLMLNYISKCLNGSQEYQLYELSKIIINGCENIFFKPSHYLKWNEEKKEIILKYLHESIYKDYYDENINYMLF